jgi:hypothetical protein
MNTAPTHLKHKPIISGDNYASVDDPRRNGTDAVALSIGYSQYNDGEDISAKVWRYPGQMWSPQSEELPVRRAFDLSILALAAMLHQRTGSFNTKHLEISIKDEEGLQDLYDFFDRNRTELEPRIRQLHHLTGQLLAKWDI